MKNPKVMIRKTRRYIISLLLTILAIYFLVKGLAIGSEEMNKPYVILFTLTLIAAMVMRQFASQKVYNSWNDIIKMIFDTDGITIEKLYEVFGDMDTPLGNPWLGKIAMTKGNSMIFGPNTEGEYIYVAPYRKDRIQVAHNDLTEFITPSKEEEWRLAPQKVQPDTAEDIIRYRFGSACLLSELTNRLDQYIHNGRIDTSEIGIKNEAQIYLFYEEFRWLGQDFYLYDTNHEEKMKITAPVPCKTFHIYDKNSGQERFTISKKLFHVMPHYVMYENGKKIGVLKKKMVLHHDWFIANTSYGRLEMKSMNAMFGSNYQVSINGTQIGTIAEKMNINLNNLVFDNFLLSVNEEKYLPLMTAMGVMAAREIKRDKAVE